MLAVPYTVMIGFKLVVDSLASIAAIVAIVATMVSWHREARRPLRVERVVVHRKQGEVTFILLVKNVKTYPVIINRIGCYKGKTHKVQKKRGGIPEHSEVFSSSMMIFDSPGDREILPSGYTDVRVSVNGSPDVPEAILFLLKTSHGYHELWCRDVEPVDIGKAEVYSLDYQYDFSSVWRAKRMYYWKLFLRAIGR